MATASAAWSGFRRWRRTRPFWGGLLLVAAGSELLLSANLTLGDLQVHFGPEGFLSYLLPLLLILCGVLSWVTPAQRLFYGILGLLTAVYSLIGLNLGGFFAGMLLGITGGALVVAWAPARPEPVPAGPGPQDPEEPRGAPEPEPPADVHPAHDPAATMIVPGFTGEPDHRRRAAPQPRAQQYPAPEQEPPRPRAGDLPRKALVIALVPLVMTAGVLLAGSHTPARAETECPRGLPSRSATAANKAAATPSSAPAAARKKARKRAPAASASPSPTATGTDTSPGNPLVDGWNDFVDGIGDLLGIGGDDEATPSPSAGGSPEPTASPSPSPSATESPSAPASGEPGQPGTPTPGASSGSASPSPTPSLPDIPCLGPRVFKDAGPDDIPDVSFKGGTLETDSLTMYDSTYDGVVQLPTDKGTVAALKFSMTKAVNKPFKLTVAEATGSTTLIESNELSTEGNVRFYTPSFKGKLFGVIPVTFTPESPPPLTLPVLWFTDVEINLAFVRCDTLKAKPLELSEKS